MTRRVLLIEDDPSTADYLSLGLREEGFTVEQVDDGRDGLYLATSDAFDAVVLDRGLPGLDGISIVKALRAAAVQTPVLFLSGRSQVEDRILGLSAGADDYLVKPFSFAELRARLDCLLRRRAAPALDAELTCGDLRIDLLTRKASRGDRAIKFLPREFKLLEHLMRNQGRVVTRVMLLEQVWDYRFNPQTSVIDTHVCRLRKKIEVGSEVPLLHTVRGAGYRLSREP